MRMPAEWEPHAATWISWPHHEPDWPGKLDAIGWVYAEIVRVLAAYETVEILCHDAAIEDAARTALAAHGVAAASYRVHRAPTDRAWLRDTGPTGVESDDGGVQLVQWGFNAWAKYENFAQDAAVPTTIAGITGMSLRQAQRPDGQGPVILEGGSIDVSGQGLLLTTEECLLSSDVQVRNPGLTRDGYEQIFRDYLGVRQTLWLGAGCVGDDTHGHVDDVARFVAPDIVVLAYEPDPADENHATSEDNWRRLQLAGGDDGAFQVIPLPYPRPITMEGHRLPASYLNFYIANGVVLVPTFNDPNDRVALTTLAEVLPDRKIVGIHAVDLVWGFGTIHCLSQQQPLGSRSVRTARTAPSSGSTA
jgi:agmatine deiminase